MEEGTNIYHQDVFLEPKALQHLALMAKIESTDPNEEDRAYKELYAQLPEYFDDPNKVSRVVITDNFVRDHEINTPASEIPRPADSCEPI